MSLLAKSTGEVTYKDLTGFHKWFLIVLVSMGSSIIYTPIYLKTLIMGIALSTRVIGENAHEPTRWPIKELPSIPATGLNSKSLASAPTKAGQ